MPDTVDPFVPRRAFARVRRLGPIIAVAAAAGLAAAWLGSSTISVPTADGGESIPFWRFFAVVIGVLPVIALHSRMADMEECATATWWRFQTQHLATTVGLCAIIYLGLSSLGMTLDVVAISARSSLGWLGLGLLSGRLFGWRLAWIVPFGALASLFYWGSIGGGRYQWWEFTANPIDHVPSLAIVVGLLIIGLIAYAATPWRRAYIRRTVEPRQA